MNESPISPFMAFLNAQRSFSAALKDSSNPYFKSKYADLNSVWEAVHEALHANGLTITQPIRINDAGQTVVITNVRYQNGELVETSECPVLCKSPNDPQAMGSAITYARRYSLASILGIVTTDDDGESAVNRKADYTYESSTQHVTNNAYESSTQHVRSNAYESSTQHVRSNDDWSDTIEGLMTVEDLNECKKRIGAAKLNKDKFTLVWNNLTKRAKSIGATYDKENKLFTI